MNLLLDIWRSILLKLKVNDIINISLVNKAFHSLSSEKVLWLFKFEEKNLQMINNEVINIKQYLNEYKKVSYASYIANCLFDLIIIERKKYKEANYENLWIYPFDIKYLLNILEGNSLELFERINADKVFIFIEIKDECLLKYFVYRTKKPVLKQNLDHKDTLILLTKIIYNESNIKVFDMYEFQRIFRSDQILNWKCNARSIKNTTVGDRIEYWGKCYSKYESLYF
jgi:hypothetical protein